MSPKARTRGEERLLAALAAGASVAEAARTASVSERTVYRRLADPIFARRLAEIRDDLVRQALNELTRSAHDAVKTLQRLLAAENEHVQLRAARTVLDQLTRLRETLELSDRISSLEHQLTPKRPHR